MVTDPVENVADTRGGLGHLFAHDRATEVTTDGLRRMSSEIYAPGVEADGSPGASDSLVTGQVEGETKVVTQDADADPSGLACAGQRHLTR